MFVVGKDLYESELSSLITSPGMSTSKLHTNEEVSLGTDWLLLLTGNEVDLTQDNGRRILSIKIIKQHSKIFKIKDILEYVRQERNTIVKHLMTIVMGYLNAGAPVMTKDVIPSFEKWDRWVRQLILWLKQEFPRYHLADLHDIIKESVNSNKDDLEKDRIAYWLKRCFPSAESKKLSFTKGAVGDIMFPLEEYAFGKEKLEAHSGLRSAIGEFMSKRKIDAKNKNAFCQVFDNKIYRELTGRRDISSGDSPPQYVELMSMEVKNNPAKYWFEPWRSLDDFCE